jgi:hypothetical protein
MAPDERHAGVDAASVDGLLDVRGQRRRRLVLGPILSSLFY